MPYKDPQRQDEYFKGYRQARRTKINARIKEYAKTHKGEKAIYDREYNRINKNQIALSHKQYRETHREQKAKKKKERYWADIQYRLSENLRSRLRLALVKSWKAGSAVRDLGCTIPELKLYLEGQFQDGMTWDNWSLKGWHIDHKLPLAYFELTNREQFLQAVHYTNLQPMWAKENIKKKNKTNICVA